MCTWQSQEPRGTSKSTGVRTVGAAPWAAPMPAPMSDAVAPVACSISRLVIMASLAALRALSRLGSVLHYNVSAPPSPRPEPRLRFMTCKPMLRVLLLLLALAAPSVAHAATKITFGITSATAFSIPHYIAEEKKYYEAEGLSMDTIVAGSAASVLQQLAAGSLNIAQAATDQTLRAILRGAPIRIIAGAASNAPFRVDAAKGTK